MEMENNLEALMKSMYHDPLPQIGEEWYIHFGGNTGLERVPWKIVHAFTLGKSKRPIYVLEFQTAVGELYEVRNPTKLEMTKEYSDE